MAFHRAGRSPFGDVRRPVEGSSDMLYKDFYENALSNASRASPYVYGVTLGPSAAVLTPEQAATGFPLMFTQPGPPVHSSTPIKKSIKQNTISSPEQRHSIHPCQPIPVAHSKISNIVTSTDALKNDVKLKVMKSHLSKQGYNQTTARLESAAENLHLELEAKMAMQYELARKDRQHGNELLSQAVGNILLSKNEPSTLTNDKEAALEAQVRNEKIKQNILEQQRKKKILESVKFYHSEYSKTYSKLQAIMPRTKKEVEKSPEIMRCLEEIRADAAIFTEQISKAKHERLTEDDVKVAMKLSAHVDEILSIVNAELEKSRLAVEELEKGKLAMEELQRRKLVEERTALEAQQAKAAEAQEGAAAWAKCCDVAALPLYLSQRKMLEDVQSTLESFMKDRTFEKYRFNLHKSATTPVNTISRVSAKHMFDKYLKLKNLLTGVYNEGQAASISDHVMGPLYVRNVLAKAFVKQGDVTVSSRPDAAFELAYVLMNLWVEVPEFGTLVQAHFYAVCPYLVPMFWPHMEEQSDHEYLRLRGYLIQNGQVEKQDMFLNRMKGVMRLYAALLITPTRCGKPNPLGMAEAWRWLTVFCNLPPQPDISSVLILEFLEVVGHDLLFTYGKQARKLLALICKEYYPRLEAASVNASKGPLARLGTFLKKAMEQGTIQSPKQRLPPKFW